MAKCQVFFGDHFVNTTENNRIKVWKVNPAVTEHSDRNVIGTLTNECGEVGHLQVNYTACALHDSKEGGSDNVIGLGDAVGRLVVFDLLSGAKLLEISGLAEPRSDLNSDAVSDVSEIIHTQGGHISRINDIEFVRASNGELHLYSCSTDKSICRWNLKNAQLLDSIPLETISCKIKVITAGDHRFIFAGYNHISVIHAQSKKTVALFQGHASQLRHLKATDDGSFLVSGSQDRFLYVWNLRPVWKTFFMVASAMKEQTTELKKLKKRLMKQSKSMRSNSHTLVLNDIPICLDIRSTEDGQSHLIAAASGTAVFVWRLAADASSKGEVSLEPLCKVYAEDPRERRKSKTKSDQRYSYIRSFQFVSDTTLRVCRGNASIAVFRDVDFALRKKSGNDGSSELHFIPEIRLGRVSIDSEEEKRVMQGEKAVPLEVVAPATEDVNMTVLGVGDSVMTEQSTMIESAMPSKKRRKSEMDATDSGNRVESDAVTFGDRLSMLESSKVVASDGLLSRSLDSFDTGIPTADSLSHLITQSLLSYDTRLFESLLSVQSVTDDEGRRAVMNDLIRNTVDKISSETATILLSRLSELFRTRPKQSIEVMCWMVPLLQRHASTLSTQLKCRKDLLSIHQAIEYQIQSLVPAFKLFGRLSLLTSQIEKVRSVSDNEAVSDAILSSEQRKEALQLEKARHLALFEHVEPRFEHSEDKPNIDEDTKMTPAKRDSVKRKKSTGKRKKHKGKRKGNNKVSH